MLRKNIVLIGTAWFRNEINQYTAAQSHKEKAPLKARPSCQQGEGEYEPQW